MTESYQTMHTPWGSYAIDTSSKRRRVSTAADSIGTRSCNPSRPQRSSKTSSRARDVEKYRGRRPLLLRPPHPRLSRSNEPSHPRDRLPACRGRRLPLVSTRYCGRSRINLTDLSWSSTTASRPTSTASGSHGDPGWETSPDDAMDEAARGGLHRLGPGVRGRSARPNPGRPGCRGDDSPRRRPVDLGAWAGCPGVGPQVQASRSGRRGPGLDPRRDRRRLRPPAEPGGGPDGGIRGRRSHPEGPRLPLRRGTRTRGPPSRTQPKGMVRPPGVPVLGRLVPAMLHADRAALLDQSSPRAAVRSGAAVQLAIRRLAAGRGPGRPGCRRSEARTWQSSARVRSATRGPSPG